MDRLSRTVANLGFTKVAEHNGWHLGPRNMARTITYYKGPSWLRVGFGRIIYDVNCIHWWDDATSRLHVWEPREAADHHILITGILRGEIKSGLVL